jgi:long-chain acyl-CoA synthetase
VTVWHIFESAAVRFADRTAVQVQRPTALDSWSYRELYDTAIDRSMRLSAAGVTTGDRCAILADNDADWCATYLGILRIGAVAVPLDTNYSAAQVATIVDACSPRVLFVNERLATLAVAATAEHPATIVADIHSPQSLGSPEPRDVPGGAGQDPAVIFYTSGTTADPKGVVLTNANLIAERDAAFQVVAVSEADSVLGVLPLFHSLAQLANLLLPCAVGARIVFLETVNTTELTRALAERQITIFACVPQFFYLLHQRVLQTVERGGALRTLMFRLLLAVNFRSRQFGINLGGLLFARVHASMGGRLRLLITGGSKFDPAVGRDLYALGFTILQAYGLTETSGAATLTAPDDAHRDSVGRALPGQQIKVLPPEDPDVDGEIAIHGPIVMKEYYNRPDATAVVMRDGWLLTGDLGRIDGEGRLTITGRKKDVIVLASGKNIYPEEVEAAYLQSVFVKEICVVGLPREDDPTSERLFAVVVPNMDLMRARRIVNAGDLLRFELEGQSIHLPAHKRVLGYDVWFDALPRTTTGKIKRHEVARRVRERRRPDADPGRGSGPGSAYDVGDGHARRAVAVIERRVAGRTITPQSNLELDLGLDSMERVELLSEVERQLGVHISDEQAHQILTVGQLIDATRAGAGAAPATATEASWAEILRDLPPPDDPVLGGLLRGRPVAARAFFLVPRLLRVFLPSIQCTGLHNVPAHGPFIISPNHQGYLDPFIVCGVLPFRLFRELFFVGAAEYFETPLMEWIARHGNCVPVDPDANLVPAMRAGAFGLAHGKILMLFPEGERSIDGSVKRFKKGAPILSRHLAVPIVPVAIRGAYEIWPRNRRIDWGKMFPWNRHRIRVRFGPPLTVADSADNAAAALQLQGTVAAMWDELGPESGPSSTETDR